MKFRGVRRLRSSFGITQMHASRVAVRPLSAWYWRGIALVLIAITVAMLISWFFATGQKIAGFDRKNFEGRMAETSAAVQQLSAENTELKSSLGASQRQAQIDHAAQTALSRSITQLQEENAHLKEEVTFFRSIMSSGKAPEGLTVQNFRIEADALPNEYRFHALLVQGGPRERDFVGKAQLMVSVRKNGATTVLTLPEDEKSAPIFDINLKYYQRLEGRFKVEPGMVINSAQLRVTDKATGQVRLTRSLSLS